ncbi:MAG: helix-turn-helix domain-containing protein [Bacteroidetes bacterium]|nr:helix-turn-helix domain-containing protein [Bacteroidota bacterium]
MSIANRIALIIHTHQLTNSTFADKLGIQRSSISHVISGRNKPSLDFLEKIVKEFPRVDAHWLLSGESRSKDLQASESKVETNSELSLSSETKEVAVLKANKKTIRIVHYFDDNTFVEYLPNEQ